MTPKTVCFAHLATSCSRSQLQTRSGPCWQTPPSSCLPGSLPPPALPHGCSSLLPPPWTPSTFDMLRWLFFSFKEVAVSGFQVPAHSGGGECDYISRKLAFFQNMQVRVCSSWTSHSFLRVPSPPALWECHLLLLLQSQQPHLEGIVPLPFTRALICTLWRTWTSKALGECKSLSALVIFQHLWQMEATLYKHIDICSYDLWKYILRITNVLHIGWSICNW